ncbi:hypothetical protein KSC_097380 [Ktedonobacter sp. SOSP1-52]|uniref:hypothetical protein n=1 Tax=Ktedonobacter sp. SOSP1-52 TaxID=2778366 RepID=UPI001916B16F|nr:hypothetical protein [Ktedonobacter sp. SOSP1-52]GHO70846.1 hypothetical protein KSC_097380 [Ktedonobacter sp. SOSP1-52]
MYTDNLLKYSNYTHFVPCKVPFVMIVTSNLACAATLRDAIYLQIHTHTLFAMNIHEALNIVRSLHPLAFVVASRLPDGDALTFLAALEQRQYFQKTPFLILKEDNDGCVKRAKEYGIHCIQFPKSTPTLLTMLTHYACKEQELCHRKRSRRY